MFSDIAAYDLLFSILAIVNLIVSIAAVISIACTSFHRPVLKFLWIAFTLMVPFLGAIAWFAARKAGRVEGADTHGSR